MQGTGKTGPYLLPYLLIPPCSGLVPTSSNTGVGELKSMRLPPPYQAPDLAD